MKVLFDTDPGIDDAMALLMAHAVRDIDLVGVTTTFGNASIDTTTRNALHIADNFGLSVPVARGAAKPLAFEISSYPDFVHGSDGLGNIGPDAPSLDAINTPAAEFIVEQAAACGGDLHIVAVGPLTNLATALAIDPELPSRIASIVIMGGAIAAAGNVTPVAEANIHSDPHAADLVFSASWPLTLVPLDVTMVTWMTPDRLQRIAIEAGAAGGFIADTSVFYEAFYYGLDPSRRGFPVHDSSAVACLLQPELFRMQLGPMRVVCDGVARGTVMQVADPSGFPANAWSDMPSHKVCVSCDSARILDLIGESLRPLGAA